MDAAVADSTVSDTCGNVKHHVSVYVLLFLLLTCAGVAFMPQACWASPKAAMAGEAKNPSPKKAKKKPTASGKKRRATPYVRSLASLDDRAALHERGINSGFGPRKVSRRATRLHKGIDISAPRDCRILAFNDGEVVFTGRKNGYGTTVIIRQLDGREALYAHMNKAVVRIGDTVRRGDHIGHVGRTGRATGYHLHFELIDEGVHLDPALHVWHGSELVIKPGDFDPAVEGQTRVASPTTPRSQVY